MNCAEIRNWLHGYVDGELDAANNLKLERHLATCAACTAEKNSLQSLRTELQKSDLIFRVPDSLKSDLRQFVRDLKREKQTRRNFGLQWLWKLLAFGATAFALLAIFLRPAGISEHDAFLNEVIASHVRSLQVGHLTDVLSGDQHTVKPWFDGKIDFAPDVKDLASEGFPIVGGRLDYLDGHAVAALVYRHNKHLINVFVWPATDTLKPETENRRGYSIINCTSNGIHYCLVSDLSASDMNQLAELLGR